MLSDLISRFRPVLTRVPILDIKRQVEILTDKSQKMQIRALVVFTFLFSAGYFIFPFDIIPDVLLGLGYLDDLAIYAFIREVAYTGAENNADIRESLYMTFKSKFIYIIGSVMLLSAIFLTILYLWI